MDESDTCLNCERHTWNPDEPFCSDECKREYNEACRDEAYQDAYEHMAETPILDPPWWSYK